MSDRKRQLPDILSEMVKEINLGPRRKPSSEQIREMHSKQGGKCALCGKSVELIPYQYEVDHKVPRSRGGGDELDNLQITHTRCNREKWNSVDPHKQLDYLDDKYQ